MRQLALALLLLPFMSLSQASASECGFKADNKTVDPNSMVLCPNNKSLQLLTSSYGEGVMVFTKDQDETYAKIQNEKSESVALALLPTPPHLHSWRPTVPGRQASSW